MNALIVIETLQPAVYSEPGGIDALLTKLEADVRAVETDISTPAGRSAVKSLAYKVARSKTALDDMGKALVADLKKQTGAVDAERRKVRERLDALAEDVRKPLTDWENADKERIAAHEAAIQRVADLAEFSDDPTSALIRDRLRELEATPERDWQEFAGRAKAIRSQTFAALTAMKETAVKREAEAAELARLRTEQIERERKERDERIAAEAEAKARRDAEESAARSAREAEARAQAEQRRLEREAEAAQARAEKAERDRVEAAARAEREKAEAAARSERDQAAAVEAERRRAADAKAAEEAAAAKREANKRHRAKVNNAAVDALVAAGIPHDQAVAAITAIARGDVPRVSISY